MYCKNCFKKISSKSRFCKYCGAPVQKKQKKIDEGKGTETVNISEVEKTQYRADPFDKKKEYRFKLRSEKEKEFPIPPKVIGIVIVIILVISAAFVFLKSSVFQPEDSITYSDYIGIWQERGIEHVETSGGVRLEIQSVSGNTMVISMGFYDGGASYNSIQVNDIGAVIKDGAAYYTFSNDGYGNSGNGVLTFKGRTIEWKSIINKNDPVYYEVLKITNSVPEETTESAETESTEATSESKTDNDYVLPNSDTEYLTKKDLKGLTQEELRIARNEIMARHGRQFNDPALAAYFEGKEWYNGTIDPETFDSQVGQILNKYEMRNVELIQSEE